MKTPKVASTRLSLPLGVSGFEPENAEVGTLAFATDSERVRVKTTAGWVDVSAGGGGGGGTVTEVTTATPGTVTITNPTGPVVNIDVSSSGGAVSSVSGSGAGINVSPTTGAVVVSNTGVTSALSGTGIAVSGPTGAVTVSNTGVTSIIAGPNVAVSGPTGAVTISSQSPLVLQSSMWDPKAIPGVNDEEFTTDPFISGAWTVRNDAAIGVAFTRVGDVDPTTPVAAPNTFRSTLSKSTVWFQGPTGVDLTISKPLVAALATRTMWTYGASASLGTTTNVSANDTYLAAAIYADSGGLPSTTNNAKLSIVSNSTAIEFSLGGIVSDTSSAAVNNSNGRWDLLSLSGYGICNDTPATRTWGFFFNRDSHMHFFMAQRAGGIGTVGHVGFAYYHPATGNAYSNTGGIVGFHFVRGTVGNVWPFTG